MYKHSGPRRYCLVVSVSVFHEAGPGFALLLGHAKEHHKMIRRRYGKSLTVQTDCVIDRGVCGTVF